MSRFSAGHEERRPELRSGGLGPLIVGRKRREGSTLLSMIGYSVVLVGHVTFVPPLAGNAEDEASSVNVIMAGSLFALGLSRHVRLARVGRRIGHAPRAIAMPSEPVLGPGKARYSGS